MFWFQDVSRKPKKWKKFASSFLTNCIAFSLMSIPICPLLYCLRSRRVASIFLSDVHALMPPTWMGRFQNFQRLSSNRSFFFFCIWTKCKPMEEKTISLTNIWILLSGRTQPRITFCRCTIFRQAKPAFRYNENFTMWHIVSYFVIPEMSKNNWQCKLKISISWKKTMK